MSHPMERIGPYVEIDQFGVWRVAGTRISVDSVVINFRQGMSADEIQRNFPTLSLEQVYGTIAYCLGHRHEVDEYLKRQKEAWDRARAASERNPSPVVQRLRAIRAGKAGQNR